MGGEGVKQITFWAFLFSLKNLQATTCNNKLFLRGREASNANSNQAIGAQTAATEHILLDAYVKYLPYIGILSYIIRLILMQVFFV